MKLNKLKHNTIKKGDWQTFFSCTNCGYIATNYQILNIAHCPMCNDDKHTKINNFLNGWVKETKRWVSTYVWFKPWTWGNGYWEKKER